METQRSEYQSSPIARMNHMHKAKFHSSSWSFRFLPSCQSMLLTRPDAHHNRHYKEEAVPYANLQ